MHAEPWLNTSRLNKLCAAAGLLAAELALLHSLDVSY